MLLPRLSSQSLSYLLPLILVSTLGPRQVLGGDVLATNGFSTCLASETIKIQRLKIAYNRATNNMTFDVAGFSEKEQNVTAVLTVTAYGKKLNERTFNPCEEGIKMLCPGISLT